MVSRHRLFLVSEEFNEIWVIKAAERPELLLYNSDDDEEEEYLQDGCDLPGWQKAKFVNCTDATVLQVGPFSTLLRRESQLPILCKQKQWESLRDALLEAPRHPPISVDCETCKIPSPLFERENIPSVIRN